MKISVITPSFNQADFIERTIQSVMMQKGNFEVEHLVMDGGSSDGTLDKLNSFTDHISLVSEADKGQSDAINKGLALATGDIVCWLNSDDLFLENSLQHVANIFESEPETEWIYGQVKIINSDDVEIRKWITKYKNLRMSRFSFAKLLQENWISQMGVFWRRDFGREIGPINESLHYAMDYDLWLRFAKKSPGRFVPENLAAFRWHDQSKTSTSYIEQMKEAYSIASNHAENKYWWSLFIHRLYAFRTKMVYRTMDLLGLGQ